MTNRPTGAPDRPIPPEDGIEGSEFLPVRDMPGAVFMIPNSHWGFEVVLADDHPGACAFYRPERTDGVLVGGTDADHVRSNRGYLFVNPSAENGLHKRTAFKLAPRYFRLHRLKLYYPERHIGRLDGMTLRTLRDELARLNPEE